MLYEKASPLHVLMMILVRTLLALRKRQKDIRQVLSMANTDKQFYYRLVTMACVELGCTLPLVTFDQIKTGYYPWRGFADLHLDFQRIDQYPYEVWSSEGDNGLELTQWYQIGCGLVYFLLFGLTRDARSRYKKMFGLSKILFSHNGDSDVLSASGEKQSFLTLLPCIRKRRIQHMTFDLRFNSSPNTTAELAQSTSEITPTQDTV